MISLTAIMSILFTALVIALVVDITTSQELEHLAKKPPLSPNVVKKCSGQNEEYTRCSSSTCFEETCAELLDPPSTKICTKDCKTGCKCSKKGYYRNSEGQCVDELTCRMCGYNQVWVLKPGKEKTCMKPGKEKTCKEVVKKNRKKYKLSPEEIMIKSRRRKQHNLKTPGCQCMNGLYRSEDGLCVSEDSCIKCEENEIYESCFSPCMLWEFTCEDASTSLHDR